MKNNIAKLTLFSLVAAALVALPAVSRAEDSTTTNPPPASTHAAKKSGQGYHGKIAAVDATAMTFTVGKTTITVDSTTKITKDGQPAVFADIVAGANVSGAYKKNADGKTIAKTVKLGEKKKAEDAATK